jgi:hypothetical protein
MSADARGKRKLGERRALLPLKARKWLEAGSDNR